MAGKRKITKLDKNGKNWGGWVSDGDDTSDVRSSSAAQAKNVAFDSGAVLVDDNAAQQATAASRDDIREFWDLDGSRFEPTAAIYKADLHHVECLMHGPLNEAMQQGIDIHNEHSYDSDDHPKLVTPEEVEPGFPCGTCGGTLDD